MAELPEPAAEEAASTPMAPPNAPEPAGPAAAPPPPSPPPSPASGSHTPIRVAVLLAVAAIAAALVGARVSILSNDASGKWQSSVRQEIKRSTAVEEDVRWLYENELPRIIQILQTRLVIAALPTAPSGDANVDAAVARERKIQQDVLTVLEDNFDPARADYSLPGGGVDLGKRLSELRASYPELLNIDPIAVRNQGERLAYKATVMSVALVPLGLVGLLGALAQTFERRRRELLLAGFTILAIAAAFALISEVAL